MKKNNFLYFEDENGTKTNVAYAPGYYWSENLDDVVVRCEIVNGKLILTGVLEKWYTPEDVKNINKDLKKFGVGDSWEFFDFYTTTDLIDDSLNLVADNNSSTFKAINSPQNLKYIQSFSDKFDEFND